MKEGIHPEFKSMNVRCACGNEFTSFSTKDNIRVEICAQCHPFFTGKQKLVDSAGRVERFYKKYSHLDQYKGKADELRAQRMAEADVEPEEESS